jgi:hypothetical protein
MVPEEERYLNAPVESMYAYPFPEEGVAVGTTEEPPDPYDMLIYVLWKKVLTPPPCDAPATEMPPTHSVVCPFVGAFKYVMVLFADNV